MVSSVRHPYRYWTLRYVRYDLRTGTAGTGTGFHTGTEHFGKFGATSTPVQYRKNRQVRYINISIRHFGKFGVTSTTVPGVPLPYAAVTSHTPWGGFPSSIARQPRGCQYLTIRLRKALGEMFPTPISFGTDTIPTAVEISSMENRPRGV